VNADEIIDDIIRREGGYVDHPADKGGPTRWGITMATLSHYRQRAVTVGEIQALTEAEARDIYREQYVAPFRRFAAYPHLLALAVDSAVQHGVSRVQGWLYAIPSVDPEINYRGLLAARMRFYGQIIRNDPSQAVFAAGWMNRLSEFLA
jgi:lysozyme family protein